MPRMDTALHRVLVSPVDVAPIASLAEWRARFEAAIAGLDAPADRALVAGFAADRVAYAFAGGYAAALQSLVDGKLDAARGARVASLCITEEGGGHPRAVKTTLRSLGDGRFVLDGRKQWATAAPAADQLLIAASTGSDEQGRNRLALVVVDARAPGVTLEAMPEPPFAPELPHAIVKLRDVAVTAADVLPGDGYEVYVKPFRTIEDTHVFLSLVGQIVRGARAFGGARELIELAVATALSLRGVAAMDARPPVTHIALAGALELGRRLVTASAPLWASAPEDVRARWERDRPLTLVAERARGERRARAWERVLAEGAGAAR
jgi:acyl-CoA dehydrogenase